MAQMGTYIKLVVCYRLEIRTRFIKYKVRYFDAAWRYKENIVSISNIMLTNHIREITITFLPNFVAYYKLFYDVIIITSISKIHK